MIGRGTAGRGRERGRSLTWNNKLDACSAVNALDVVTPAGTRILSRFPVYTELANKSPTSAFAEDDTDRLPVMDTVPPTLTSPEMDNPPAAFTLPALAAYAAMSRKPFAGT